METLNKHGMITQWRAKSAFYVLIVEINDRFSSLFSVPSKRNDSIGTTGKLMKVWVKVKSSSHRILSADCRSTVGRLSAVSQPTVGRFSAVSRPTVGQQTADSLLVFP